MYFFFLVENCEGTNLQARISLAHSLKYPYKPINYFGPPQIFPTYYPNTFHILPKYFPMLLPNLGLHKYYPISLTYYYPTWAPTNTYHTITKIGPQNYIISIKAQTHLPCGQNPKSPTKLSYKIRCYSASLKHITTWHLKVRCYTTPLKSIATQQYFYKITNYLQKSKYYFGNFYKKNSILFCNFYKKDQYNFGNFYNEPNTIWQLFTKSPIFFWQLFTKAQYYFGNYLQKT